MENKETEQSAVVPTVIVKVEHTFTPQRMLALRDTLMDVIARHMGATRSEELRLIAEGLLMDQIVDLAELNRVVTSKPLDGRDIGPEHEPEMCDAGICDFSPPHEHGFKCNHLCPCGLGQ